MGVGFCLCVYLIDLLLLSLSPGLIFSLSLCPEVLEGHCSSGPSIQSQDKGKGLLEATSTFFLPPDLQPGLASGLHCASGPGEKPDTTS